MELAAIAFVLIAVYLFFILVSYNQADPGWFKTGSGEETQNIGGTFGAYFSDFVLQFFGVFAYFY